MADFDRAIVKLLGSDWDKYNGYAGEPPSTEKEYKALLADNKMKAAGCAEETQTMFKDGFTGPSWTDIKNATAVEEQLTKREDEYPSIVDQLDDIYHNGIDGWKATIKAVKDKYPKE